MLSSGSVEISVQWAGLGGGFVLYSVLLHQGMVFLLVGCVSLWFCACFFNKTEFIFTYSS